MKKLLILSVVIIAVAATSFISCKKDKSNGTGTINFASLVARDSVITIDSTTKLATTQIIATATGSNLSYTWSSEGGWGTFYGSGSTIVWSICHADKFKITCTVKDESNNSASKDVYIRSKN